MVREVQLGKARALEYKFKYFPIMSWLGYKAWCVWSSHPKWLPPETNATTATESGETPVTSATRAAGGYANKLEEDASQPRVRSHEAAKRPEEQFELGSKCAKLIRQEDLRKQAVRSMAESSKCKSDALEERNAILAAFSRPEAEELPETTQFFEALR